MMQGMIVDRPTGNLRRAITIGQVPIISIESESPFFLFHADGLCTA
jgi:hypothetical protein